VVGCRRREKEDDAEQRVQDEERIKLYMPKKGVPGGNVESGISSIADLRISSTFDEAT